MAKRGFRPIVVLATNNKHKVKEIKSILRVNRVRARVKTLADFPRAPEVVENKPTIEGNAAKKAKEVARRTGHLALADDTGLFIKPLRGAPGVVSARYAGPHCSFDDNIRKVLRKLKGVPFSKRHAKFRTIAALATPKGKVVKAEGKVSGRITMDAEGVKGFGYDPIFYVPKFKKTFAAMTAKEKNSVSHRGRAFRHAARLIKALGW